ncbi:plant UBX domain-containing protein 9 isoform X3 [Vigna angularis]|uniref:plant UBX domain-containing protein 9 isoform X3 n=1 Tax=Phaseolus angularis TaxID=3914 RepID=UPI000809AAB9|nr:plant UBX domain-containing protein 9 isoform X3 [Vigna angularis]
MATPEAVAAFQRITGAPEFVAVQKLEEYGGNLNEAINAHFLEGDRHILSGQGKNPAAAPRYNNTGASNQDRGSGSNGILPFLNAARRFRPSLLLDPNYRRELRDLYKGTGGAGGTAYTNRPQPLTSHPAEVRDVPAWINNPFEPHYQPGLGTTEEAMLQAAIEASKMETRGGSSWERIDVVNNSSNGGLPQTLQQEDDDLARAIASSLETAEQEKNSREKEGQLGGHFLLDKGKKTNSSRNQLELGTSSDENVVQDVAQPVSSHLSIDSAGGHSQQNEDVFLSNKWGGISAEEINEALLVETALFGEISTHSVPSLPNLQHRPKETQCMSTSMSQLLTDSRLLKQQQDADYLASLRADKQKELNSFNNTESQSSREEESCKKMLEEKELMKILDKKKLRLSKEPLLSDEVVTIVVRMPDGGRCERRFLKTDKLELLFDFIDVSGAQKPGTYRFVKSYPRRAYSINDCSSTFNEVGLNKSNEALFLELI